MQDQDIQEIKKELERYFNANIPNPYNYPEVFLYYLKVYKICSKK